MWVPASAQELLQRLEDGIAESAGLDGKREIGRNPELAVDIAAMTVNGGVLLVGVDENDAGTHLVSPAPVTLAGKAERVAQVASTAISEPPVIETRPLPLSDDPANGFLAISVPASPRAPHQITLRGRYEGRFYTRDATGNRVLGQAEIEALYARRARWERDFAGEMRAHAGSVVPLAPGERNTELTVRCEPVPGIGPVFRPGPSGDPATTLRSAVAQAVRASRAPADFGGFGLLAEWRRVRADAWEAMYWPNRSEPPRLRAVVESNGAATVAFVVSEPSTPDAQISVLNEVALAAHTVHGLALAGQVLRHLGFSGVVDVGVLVRPLHGRFSLVGDRPEYESSEPYLGDEHLRHQRVLADTLFATPAEVAHELLDELIEAFAGWGYDVFDRPWQNG